MFKKLWDGLVQRAIESIVAAIAAALAVMLGASAAILQWTTWPWYWRRAAMASIFAVVYWGFLRFAPRWMIPKATSKELDLIVRPDFEGDTLLLHVTNQGEKDLIGASVGLIQGVGFPWPVFPSGCRWFRQTTDTREILKGSTQHIELVRVTLRPMPDRPNEQEIEAVKFLNTHEDIALRPNWIFVNRLSYPLGFRITMTGAESGLEKHVLVDVNFSVVGSTVLKYAAIIENYSAASR
jgi:hypothetical protein